MLDTTGPARLTMVSLSMFPTTHSVNTNTDRDDDDDDDHDHDMMIRKSDSYDDHSDPGVHICQAQVAFSGGYTPISLSYWRSTNKQKGETKFGPNQPQPTGFPLCFISPGPPRSPPLVFISGASHVGKGTRMSPNGSGRHSDRGRQTPFVFHVIAAFALRMV
jgi:hypothetical protein